MDKIRSLCVVKKVLECLNGRKKLNLIRYSAKWQNKLNIGIKKYIELYIEEDFMETTKKYEKKRKKEKEEAQEKILKLFKKSIKYFLIKFNSINDIYLLFLIID